MYIMESDSMYVVLENINLTWFFRPHCPFCMGICYLPYILWNQILHLFGLILISKTFVFAVIPRSEGVRTAMITNGIAAPFMVIQPKRKL